MLHTLAKLVSRSKKRLGRGTGSGKGNHTVGRGQKGHTSRQGKPIPLWFEGGQLPLIKRLPYLRGKSHFQILGAKPLTLDVSVIEKLAGKDVTPETLAAAKIIKHAHIAVRFVGKAKLTSVGQVRGVGLSSGARASIEAAGGSIAA